MPGFSLTLLLLPRAGSSAFSAEKIIQYLDAPTDAPGWPWHAHQEPKDESESLVVEGRSEEDGRKGLPIIKRMSFDHLILLTVTAARCSSLSGDGTLISLGTFTAADPETFIAAIKRAAEALVEAEPEITRQDTIAGDGDAGLTLKAGSEGTVPSCS